MSVCQRILLVVRWTNLLAISLAAVPQYPPGPISFYDYDTHAGQLGGIVEFPRAYRETDITRYELYFGSSPTQKLMLFVTFPKTGLDPEYDIPMDTPVPVIGSTIATHFLAFSVNSDGEHRPGVSFEFRDRATPIQGPAGIDFWDVDYDRAELGGHVTIQHATNEGDVDQYMLYFGMGTLQTVFVSSFAKTGALVHNFVNNTPIPVGATHLLAFTVNSDGFTINPAVLEIIDHGLPTETAISVDFTDSDLGRGEVSGIVYIGMAASEEFLTHYAVYFGKGAGGPREQLVAFVPVAGENTTHLIPADTLLPEGVTHLLVFGKNRDGESAAVMSTPFRDRAIPLNSAAGIAFFDEDIDRGEAGGLFLISPATDESDVTRYVLYFADAFLTPLATIAEVEQGPPDLNYTMPLDTPIPSGTTQLLVKTGNIDGVMLTGVGTALDDRAVPLIPPAAIEFIDQDLDGGQLNGIITVTRASSEAEITFYRVYYGQGSPATSAATMLGETIWTDAVTSLTSNYAIFFVAPHTPIPLGATHLLAFSGNAVGEIRTGISVTLIDRTDDFPTVSVTGLQFVDFDMNLFEISGPFSWSAPGVTTGLTHYAAFLAKDEYGTNRQPIPGGSNMPLTQTVLTIPLHTQLLGFTHMLVYAYNTFGEGPGAAFLITDRALPIAVVSDVKFQDEDPNVGLVGGKVEWSAPANPLNAAAFTGYAVYFADDATLPSVREKQGEVAYGTNFLNVPLGVNAVSSQLSYVMVYTVNAMGEALAGASAPLVDLSLPVHVVTELSFFDQDLGIGELGGSIEWTEPVNRSGIDFYRVYFEEADTGLRMNFGETPILSSAVPVPFNTHLLNFTNIVVVAVNAVGEALIAASIQIKDHTAESCPTDVKHDFSSSRWRLVAGTVSKAWRLRAVHFYEDSFCTIQVPAVPDKYPRRPRQTQGSPFANPPAPDYLHDLFRAPVLRRTSWANGTQLPYDPDVGPWWSTGMPCSEPNETTLDREFPQGSSRCYVGFNWESDSFIVANRVYGSSGTVEAASKNVHCVEVEQSKDAGGYASMLALQWYNPDRAAFQTLMQKPVNSGGFVQLSYQHVVAAECALQGR